MASSPEPSTRHPEELALLSRAAGGDRGAVQIVLGQLGSGRQWLQQVMTEAICESPDPGLWRRLLRYLSVHGWDGAEECERWLGAEALGRTDAVVASLFVGDSLAARIPAKMAVLQEGLTDPDCRVRATAAWVLGLRAESRAGEAPFEGGCPGDLRGRLRAVDVLAKLRDERGGWALVQALASGNERLHWEAMSALSQYGPKAVPALVGALRSPDAHVRWHAARALGDIGSASAAKPLVESLGDPDHRVGFAAAEALASLGGSAIPSILERLSRHALSEDARQAAGHMINRLHPSEIKARLQPLREALHGPEASSRVPTTAAHLLETWESIP